MSCPKLLLIEGDPAIREALRECLEAEGYPVCCAGDYAAAEGMLAAGCAPVAVILDVAFPLEGALDTLRLLRENQRLRGAPLLLTTAFPVPRDARGASPVLEKPYELETLLRALRELLAARLRDVPGLSLP